MANPQLPHSNWAKAELWPRAIPAPLSSRQRRTWFGEVLSRLLDRAQGPGRGRWPTLQVRLQKPALGLPPGCAAKSARDTWRGEGQRGLSTLPFPSRALGPWSRQR